MGRSISFIEVAQMVAGVPALTPAQREAIDLLMALAEELSFPMRFESGDMQLVNNHVIYHARTAFEDDPGSGHVRLLYRLWLSMPNSRPLPPGHGCRSGTGFDRTSADARSLSDALVAVARRRRLPCTRSRGLSRWDAIENVTTVSR